MKEEGSQAAIAVIVIGRLKQCQKTRQEGGNFMDMPAVQHTAMQSSRHARAGKNLSGGHFDPRMSRDTAPGYDAG